jgi:phosphatidylserine/phosphatidylglycerophosphate/cardiolipin synthase-like enzyme
MGCQLPSAPTIALSRRRGLSPKLLHFCLVEGIQAIIASAIGRDARLGAQRAPGPGAAWELGCILPQDALSAHGVKFVYAAATAMGLLVAGCGQQASIPKGVEVYFSPSGGATEAVVNALAHATNSVLVQAYSFTSAPIARALVDAQRRGVKVQVILDRSQRTEKYSEADFLSHEGVPTRIDARHAIAHNKIMIVDGYLVLTGSFNFTKAAEEHNAENLLVINDPVLAKKYLRNWQEHEAHSEAYQRTTRAE